LGNALLKIFKEINILSIMQQEIRTHKYWMTIKEYKKWSKNVPKIKVLNNDKILIRRHIIFE
jgi:hypothetical protein